MKFNFIITIIHNVQSFKDKIGIETDREILKVKLIKVTNHQEKPKQIQAKCQVNPPHPLENEDNNTYLKKNDIFGGSEPHVWDHQRQILYFFLNI